MSSALLDATRPHAPSSIVKVKGNRILQFVWPERGPGSDPYKNPWAVPDEAPPEGSPKKKKKKAMTLAYYCKMVLLIGVEYRAARVRRVA